MNGKEAKIRDLPINDNCFPAKINKLDTLDGLDFSWSYFNDSKFYLFLSALK